MEWEVEDEDEEEEGFRFSAPYVRSGSIGWYHPSLEEALARFRSLCREEGASADDLAKVSFKVACDCDGWIVPKPERVMFPWEHEQLDTSSGRYIMGKAKWVKDEP